MIFPRGCGLPAPNPESQMQAVLELQSAPASESLLARARVHRKLTLEEAAARAGISEDAVRWLEEGRVYRFPSSDLALEAMLLYATALGIDHEEALELAGRPVEPRRTNPWPRLAALLGIAAALAVLVAGIVLASHHGRPATAGA